MSENNQSPHSPAVQYASGQYPTVRDDEIDLKELILGFWAEKWLIAGVTAFFTAIALTYALLATPFYKTEALLMVADEAQREKINSLELISLDAESNLASIYSSLTSRDILQSFFIDHESDFSVYFDGGADAKKAFGRFLKDGITVELPDPKKDIGKGTFLRVSTILPQQVDAERLLLDFINVAVQAEQVNLENSLKNLISVKVSYKESELQSVKTEQEATHLNRIKQLSEAKAIADELKLIEPQSIAAMANRAPNSGGSSYISAVGVRDNALYLYGSRFLGAEVEALKMRTDSSFVDERIPKLIAEIEKLKRLDVAHLKITADDSALYLARIKSSPYRIVDKVKPKRALIVLLGIFLGGFLGLFVVFFKRVLKVAA